MYRKYLLISTMALVMLSVLILIGCGGGGGGGSDVVTPTQEPTSTGTPFDNTYRVLVSQSARSTGNIIILPSDASIPSGYLPAPGANISYNNGQGVLDTAQAGTDGQFNAVQLGIPGISGEGSLDSVATVDVNYNGREETNIPLPVFEGQIPGEPGEITFIKIVPNRPMVAEGASTAFFCIGITGNGHLIPMKNVQWSVDDESIIRIVETPDNGRICVVEGVQGGVFPEPNFAYLTAEASGGPTPQPTAQPEGQRPIPVFTDTAKVAVMSPPETDATVSGQLVDSEGNPVADARMVFRSAQIPEPEGKEGENPFMAFPTYTDESGNYTVNVIAGDSYSVLAMIPQEMPTPSPTGSPSPPHPTPTGSPPPPHPTPTGSPPSPHPTPTGGQQSPTPGPGPGPGPQPHHPMKIYSVTPDPFGPVEAGSTTQDFILGDPVGPGPTPPPPQPTMSPPPPFPTPTGTPPFPTPTGSPPSPSPEPTQTP